MVADAGSCQTKFVGYEPAEVLNNLAVTVSGGTGPFTYTWQRIGGSESGNGNLATISMDEVISGLLPGQYAITVNDNFGNLDIILDEIIEPDPLLLTITTSDYNGQNISCLRADDGTLTAIVSGGESPYQLDWSNGRSGVLINNLAPDLYELTVTDNLGCMITASMVITEPMPIEID